MEEFYYAAISSLLKDNTTNDATSTKLNEIKAKIVRLHGVNRRRRLIDTDENDSIYDETPTIFHIVTAKMRRHATHNKDHL
jgi:hypothetical protein